MKRKNYKRKSIVLLMALCIFFMQAIGCSSDLTDEEQKEIEEKTEELNNGKKDAANITASNEIDKEEPIDIEVFSENDVISKLATTEFHYDYSHTSEYCLVVKNNSDFNINLTCLVTARDSENRTRDEQEKTIEAIDKGESVCFPFYLEYAPAKVEYTFSASEAKAEECAIGHIQAKYEEKGFGVDVTVAYLGEYSIEKLLGCALFFEGDEFLGYDEMYFYTDDTNQDAEIQPRTSTESHASSYLPFDRVELYFSGKTTY